MTANVPVAELRALIDNVGAPSPSEPAAPAPLSREARAALQQALRLLSLRGYPVQELRRRLLRRHEPDAVDAAVESLAGTPFLDDGAWAAAYVASLRGRERSATLLRRELAAKGVGADDVSAALASHDDGEAALAAAKKRAGALARLVPEVRERRLRDYLLRRGFSSGAIKRALEATLQPIETG